MNTQQKLFLNQFGNRVTFDPIERMFYGHDMAAMPKLVKPLIGNTTPNAVVQPKNESELVEVVRWAYQQGIPITPRAKASSGYGGVIPIKKGLVVDFFHMKEVLAVDKAAMTATVQPGITWEQLDSKLSKYGLTLRLYPTSYPSSSAGGWLAQGGVGIGSYQYGTYRQNVISARVVLPTGEVREFSDEDLDLIADAEGITGLISQVTLHVQPQVKMEVVAVACPDAHDMQNLIQAMLDAEMPIWSMVFISPRMAELKNLAPLREQHGHPVEEKVLLPAAYVLTFAFRTKDSSVVRTGLQKIIKAGQAEILSQRIADHEWKNRFKLMIVKRLGPSLVPAEVVIPLASLGDVMTEIEHKIHQPVVKEGVVIRQGKDGKPEVAILGFIPSDQRKFSYNFVFGLVLTILKIADHYGGRPYSTGLYFSSKADQVLGDERLARLRVFKKEVDAKGLLNPGKVTGHALMSTALSIAGLFEPLIRPFGNQVTAGIGEPPTKPVRDIPPDIAWYAYTCSQCGFCVNECDQFYGRGWESQSPRGKWYWLREYLEGRTEWNQKVVDTFLSCTTCELCNLRCCTVMPIESSWMKMRGLLVEEDKRMTFPPFEMMAAALKSEGDIWAGYRKNRSDWFPVDLQEKHGPDRKAKNIYFAGCTASYVEHDIAMASVRLLDAARVDFSYLGEKESCCATPMLVAGKWDLFAETMKKNIRAVKEAGADTVITSCPACDMMWRHVYPEWAKKLGIEFDINTRHYSEIVSEQIKSGEFSFPDNQHESTTVTWHDSCHIGRVSGVYDPPRVLIKAIPNVNFVEMNHNRENAHCCGSVLTLLKDPPVAAEVGKMRIEEAVGAGAEKVLALCPCCEFQLRVSADKKNLPVEIVDLARFSTSALGYDFPDPKPEVRRQWAVFEAMIELMTPEGFASLLETMWPELIQAMPFGMGSMMRVMGKMPGMLNLMKPLFPVVFPRLLPLMMPKMMPVILERLADRIPMPDYMAEQMPDLMPKVMDNLMPHMIEDIVPLMTDKVITYLKRDAN